MLASIALVAVLAANAAEPKGDSIPGAPQDVRFEGGSGEGCERPVVIRGAKGARDLVAGEIAWLRKKHPGYKFRDNAVDTRGKRTFEEITIEMPGGKTRTVCFDVTEGFGSF